MTRVLSGIRATGDLHLGNYLGAIRQWVELQNTSDCFFFIADLHGLTSVGPEHSGQEFESQRMRTGAAFLASGLDPNKATLFLQSAVPQHTELLWYLSTVARKGELERMTQWKDKAGKNQAGASATLFFYPVLMAADILLYDADEVPVGDDQRQHVEVTRDWAERFNGYFGPVFGLPRATVPPEGARVMDLQAPGQKMSKSSGSDLGVVFLDDPPDKVRHKIRRAVTDAAEAVRWSREQPGVSNLLEIYAATTRTTVELAQEAFAGSRYGDFKNTVADAVVSELDPIRGRMIDYQADRGELARQLGIGSDRASGIAEKTCERVRAALGVGRIAGS